MTPLYFVAVPAAGATVYAAPSSTATVLATVPGGSLVAVATASPEPAWLAVTVGGAPGWLPAAGTTKQPRLVVDASHDVTLEPDDAAAWAGVAADLRYVGVILKASQGVTFTDPSFRVRWPAVLAAATAAGRYGQTLFRGAYHYLSFTDDPAAQVDHYLATVAGAGGWADGDLIPIVDVERGRPPTPTHPNPNYGATAAQVEACTSTFVERVKAATGQRVMLYGRGAMEDLHITSRMNADALWNPGYTHDMPSPARAGWAVDDVALWQYTDGTVDVARFPVTAPGLPAIDQSVAIPDDLPTLVRMIVRASTK
ncbi:MAG: glycoside hydrolase family 25 protein [Kofleriaceae bacterium]